MPIHRLGKRSVERRSPRRAPLRVIGIAYDGQRTEDAYFRGWARRLGNCGVFIAPFYIQSGGNVLHAIHACNKTIRREGPFDETWCVCDTDDTPEKDLAEAARLAKEYSIKLCTSTRSFEVWIALHFEKISLAPITDERSAIKLVARYYTAYTARCKEVPFSVLLPRSEDACANAKWLDEQNLKNPTTRVADIVSELILLDQKKSKRRQ